jgi:hypothetical protein
MEVGKADERRFPIQGENVQSACAVNESGAAVGRMPRREPGWVPWAVAEAAYEVYARRYGKDQSLEVLAQRGGFSWSELVGLIRGDDEAIETLPFSEAGRIVKNP